MLGFLLNSTARNTVGFGQHKHVYSCGVNTPHNYAIKFDNFLIKRKNCYILMANKPPLPILFVSLLLTLDSLTVPLPVYKYISIYLGYLFMLTCTLRMYTENSLSG